MATMNTTQHNTQHGCGKKNRLTSLTDECKIQPSKTIQTNNKGIVMYTTTKKQLLRQIQLDLDVSIARWALKRIDEQLHPKLDEEISLLNIYKLCGYEQAISAMYCMRNCDMQLAKFAVEVCSWHISTNSNIKEALVTAQKFLRGEAALWQLEYAAKLAGYYEGDDGYVAGAVFWAIDSLKNGLNGVVDTRSITNSLIKSMILFEKNNSRLIHFKNELTKILT